MLEDEVLLLTAISAAGSMGIGLLASREGDFVPKRGTGSRPAGI